MSEAAGIAGLILACLIGVAITAFRLPGTWLIVAAAAAYGWLNDWQRITGTWVLILVGIAVLGEIVELLASVVTARRAGASRQAAWGGLIGGFLGMFFLSLPMPIIGTFVGAVLGCFAGAALAEVFIHNQLGRGARVGFFSALGFAVGAATKIGIAVAMAGITTVLALWPQVAQTPGDSVQARGDGPVRRAVCSHSEVTQRSKSLDSRASAHVLEILRCRSG